MLQLKYLKKILGNFGCYPPPPNGIADQVYLNESPLVRGRLSPKDGHTYGIKREAAHALYDMTDNIYKNSSKYLKGCTYKDMSDKVFDVMMEFFHKVPEKIDATTVDIVDEKIKTWFHESTRTTHLFIPCDITPHYVQPFTIGPIHFCHRIDFANNLLENPHWQIGFEPMFAEMERYHACWMAELDITDAMPERAAEIGNLAVDLALVALQLVVPHDESKRVARLGARRTPTMNISVRLVAGQITGGSENRRPGRTISGPEFEQILLKNSAVLISLGNRVSAFLTEHAVLPRLNESWSDAAYWFHEGIAEPLDTLAVPKLETAIEVLFRAVSSKGSEKRITQAIKTFYGLDSDQMLGPDSAVTVKQFSKGLVSDRSRLLHGTLSTLSTDMRVSRSNLTVLAHELLVSFSLQLDQYASIGQPTDDIDPFLDWVVKAMRTEL